MNLILENYKVKSRNKREFIKSKFYKEKNDKTCELSF